jgi:V8-like Glu-specific endopeptidase
MTGSTQTPDRRAPRRALLALLAGVASLLGAAPAVAAPSSERVSEPAASVRDYWTAQRMRAADPVPPVQAGATTGAGVSNDRPLIGGAPSYVPAAAAGAKPRAGGGGKDGVVPGLAEAVPDPSATDLRAHGKVFFTIPEGADSGDYVCSGTAVTSHNRSLVWTAGHCTFEITGGGFVTNWTFVPAYDAGVAPFGEWPAKRLGVPKAYEMSENLHYDLGAAAVRTSSTGQRLQDVTGARGIAFDQPRDQLYDAYGYPAEPPFTGEQEYTCESENAGSDQTVGSGPATMSIECNMTGGSSGGGWIAGSTLLSVTSYGYASDPFHLYGPYMSRGAKKLYRSVSGFRKKKHHHHGHKRARSGTAGGG